jgi:hypothetical protein
MSLAIVVPSRAPPLETMTFEFHHVWPYLVADDADANAAFAEFSHRAALEPLPMTEPDKGSVVGILKKP